MVPLWILLYMSNLNKYNRYVRYEVLINLLSRTQNIKQYFIQNNYYLGWIKCIRCEIKIRDIRY